MPNPVQFWKIPYNINAGGNNRFSLIIMIGRVLFAKIGTTSQDQEGAGICKKLEWLLIIVHQILLKFREPVVRFLLDQGKKLESQLCWTSISVNKSRRQDLLFQYNSTLQLFRIICHVHKKLLQLVRLNTHNGSFHLQCRT